MVRSRTRGRSLGPGQTWRDNGHKALCPVSSCTQYGTDQLASWTHGASPIPPLLHQDSLTTESYCDALPDWPLAIFARGGREGLRACLYVRASANRSSLVATLWGVASSGEQYALLTRSRGSRRDVQWSPLIGVSGRSESASLAEE